ncbi:uncharacterized protein LY89DRAFT_601279 [Mollisia scopiformis]|uniref:DUF6594 domain-containing protein n=1 Tax=Mollisia scopiformis TaxID=149040 RepID=A0A132B5Y1_MOLSC|nr:uncharacterized protein LY89DRAFT_601279 [Mollisia scopiformis]KUJ07663.1 hypothetical protein LY89DRAFT_601279 [Mollisia scopiformis]
MPAFRRIGKKKSSESHERDSKAEESDRVRDRSVHPLTQDEIDEKPWKYIGYRGYTDFIASDNDFLMVRRFASVSARIVLSLQDQVMVLEEQLNELDWRYSKQEEEDVNNGTFRDDEEERVELLESLRLKILQYSKLNLADEFVLQQAEIKKHPTASPRDINSLQNWHFNHQYRAIDGAEQAYLSHTRDLYSVVPKEKTPLRRLLERSATFRIHWLWKEEKPPELPLFERDNPFEVLAATAAYSAVLMVFLQLNTPAVG